MTSYDLAIIGSGPGGYVAAIRAAQLGMQVALVEEDALGGVCLNWGCIPSKAILTAAEHFEDLAAGRVPGLKVEGLTVDFGGVIDASRKAADRLTRGVAHLMKKNQIEIVRGRGRLVGGGQLSVTNGEGLSLMKICGNVWPPPERSVPPAGFACCARRQRARQRATPLRPCPAR